MRLSCIVTLTEVFLCAIQNVHTWCLLVDVETSFSKICRGILKQGWSIGPEINQNSM